MKTKGILLILGAVALLGCDSGDTPIETYKPAPGQVTDPSAPPVQATTPKNSSDALQNNTNLPPAARDALLHGKGGK
jgi:hypothetical protein